MVETRLTMRAKTDTLHIMDCDGSHCAAFPIKTTLHASYFGVGRLQFEQQVPHVKLMLNTVTRAENRPRRDFPLCRASTLHAATIARSYGTHVTRSTPEVLFWPDKVGG